MKGPIDKITLGITDDEVPLGSHLIHFWQTDEEFERGVRFLELGIADEFQHCVLFGHDEANHRVLATTFPVNTYSRTNRSRSESGFRHAPWS